MDLCNRIWSEEKILEEWKKGLLIKLPKKGNLSYCKNWHGIVLQNVASKVFCRVILGRIKIELDEKLREEQAGFRAGRSCTYQKATLQIIVEQSIEWQSYLYINFIDFKKAFQPLVSVERFCGGCCGTTGCLTRWSLSSELSLKAFLLMWYTMNMITGVRQGCLLSPLLFLVALD